MSPAQLFSRHAVLLVITVHFFLLLWLGLTRQWGHMASLNDLGVFDQAVWGTLHGDWFLNTSNHFNEPINWLGFHFNLILLGFVPFYAIWPAPEWFAIAQAFALSSAAWPLFLIARHLLGSERAGLVWVLVYLSNPFILNAGAWDFHPITLAVPFLVLAFYAIVMGRARLLVGSCLFLLMVQEQMGLSVAGLGLVWAWERRHAQGWRVGIPLALLGVAHLLVVVGVLMPMLSPAQKHLMLSSDLGQLSRYGWLGTSFGDVIHTLLTQPLFVLKTVLIEMQGWVYLLSLLMPVIGLSLLAPVLLLPGVADLAANLLSANPMPRLTLAYHGCTVSVVFIVAALFGMRRICERTPSFAPEIMSGIVMGATMFFGYLLAPLPLPGSANWWQPSSLLVFPDRTVSRVLDQIGEQSSISVQANVGPHFSRRHEIHVFPARLSEVEFVVLHLSSPTGLLLPPGREYIGNLSHHLQMATPDYLSTIDCLLADGAYGVTLWDSPWLVLSRSMPRDEARLAEVRAALVDLSVKWQVPDTVLPAACSERP